MKPLFKDLSIEEQLDLYESGMLWELYPGVEFDPVFARAVINNRRVTDIQWSNKSQLKENINN